MKIPWKEISLLLAENRARTVGNLVCAHLPATPFTFELLLAVQDGKCYRRMWRGRRWSKATELPASRFNDYLSEPGRA